MQKIGQYSIIRKLGEGGMGRIFLVKDETEGTFWAAKQFKGDMSNPLFVQRFRREFRALKTLEHPAIVRVREMESNENLLFFLMEYIDGKSLDHVLAQPREHDLQWINQVLTWIKYLCETLEYIHSKRMIHRDLKPGNIMIMGPDANPPLKLLDFGIIHWLQSDTTTTAIPTFLGSLRYMAPEQMNSSSVDLRSDLYSLGVIMYEAITGRAPFAVDNPLLLMTLHQTAEPPPPIQHNLNINENLQNLMITLLAKRPDDRPNSACEVADWIQRIQDGTDYVKPDPRCSVFMTGLLFTPDLCGREVEMRKLVQKYDETAHGQLNVVTVHGKTGIGKSRLVTQFQRMPELAQQIVCYGEFQKDGPIHNGILYALKRGHAGARKRQMIQPFNRYLQYDHFFYAIDETIKSLEGNPADGVIQAVNLKQIAAQILNILDQLAGKQQLLLILDDVHLAKSGDFLLLKHLIQLHSMGTESGSHKGMMLVLGYRDENSEMTFALAEFLEWLNERQTRTDIHLKGLDKIAVNRMVTSLLGGSSSPTLGSVIFEESSGNPLHVVELLRDLIENQPDPMWNYVESDEGAPSLGDNQRITQIIGRRVERFEDNVREVVQAGAILGKIFRADELEEVSGIDENLFLDQVDQLLRQRIFEEDIFEGGTYRFTHLKLRDAVYEKIPEDEKMRLHSKALSTLETLHKNNIGRVAERALRHAEFCDQIDKQVDFHIAAANYADSMGDQIVSRDHLLDAQKLLPGLDIPEKDMEARSIDIKLKLGSVWRRIGEVPQAEKVLLEVLAKAQEQSKSQITAKASKQLGALWGAQGKVYEAVDILKEALSIFEKLKQDDEVIDCLINIGATYNHAEQFDFSMEFLRKAMEKAQLIGDIRRLAMSLINIGVHFASRFKGEEALPYLQRARQLCDDLGDNRLKAFAIMGIASSYISPELIETHRQDIIDLTDQADFWARLR